MLATRSYAAQRYVPSASVLVPLLQFETLTVDDIIDKHKGFRFRFGLKPSEDFVLERLRAMAAEHHVTLQRIFSAIIYKGFGAPPLRPQHVPQKIWKLWAEQPLTRAFREPTIEEFCRILTIAKLTK